MTLRHMRIFVTVCSCKSITLASEKLYIAQPTVSLAIKEIEEYYGVSLFDRISRKLYLTETGKLFLSYATQIVTLFDEMETKIKNPDAIGTLRIGASITTGTHLMPGLAATFYKTHPQIKLQVTVENSDELEKRIISNDLDLALIEGAIHNAQIQSEEIMEDELVLLCGANHTMAEPGCIEIDRLSEYDFLLREKGSGARELFDSTLLTYNIVIKPLWESVSTHALINAVMEGLGLTVLPYMMVKSDIESGRLKQIKIKNVSFKRHFCIIFHRDKYITESARDFMSLCKSEN